MRVFAAEELQDAGFAFYGVECKVIERDGTVHRVYAGPYASLASARAQTARFAQGYCATYARRLLEGPTVVRFALDSIAEVAE